MEHPCGFPFHKTLFHWMKVKVKTNYSLFARNGTNLMLYLSGSKRVSRSRRPRIRENPHECFTYETPLLTISATSTANCMCFVAVTVNISRISVDLRAFVTLQTTNRTKQLLKWVDGSMSNAYLVLLCENFISYVFC